MLDTNTDPLTTSCPVHVTGKKKKKAISTLLVNMKKENTLLPILREWEHYAWLRNIFFLLQTNLEGSKVSNKKF